MGWSTPTLKIDNVLVDLPKAISLVQNYEFIGGQARLRMASGRSVVQTRWSRLKTTISGTGNVPPGLWGIDWGADHVLSCASPLSVDSTTNTAIIPVTHRGDYGVECDAWVDGSPVHTPVTSLTTIDSATSLATATAVGGATGYTFTYWPELAVTLAYTDSFDRSTGKYSWTITAEEK